MKGRNGGDIEGRCPIKGELFRFLLYDDFAEVAFGYAGSMSVFGKEDGKFALLYIDVGRRLVGKECDVFFGIVRRDRLFQFIGRFQPIVSTAVRGICMCRCICCGFHAGGFLVLLVGSATEM